MLTMHSVRRSVCRREYAAADEPEAGVSKAHVRDRRLHGERYVQHVARCGAGAGTEGVSTHHACMPVNRIRPPVGALHQHLRHDGFLHALHPQRSAAPSHPQPAALQEQPSLLAAVDRRAAPLRVAVLQQGTVYARLRLVSRRSMHASSACRASCGAPGPRRPCR